MMSNSIFRQNIVLKSIIASVVEHVYTWAKYATTTSSLCDQKSTVNLVNIDCHKARSAYRSRTHHETKYLLIQLFFAAFHGSQRPVFPVDHAHKSLI